MPIRQRKHQPKPVNKYTEYREQLREEFDFACAYCEILESERGGQAAFEIDHYKPQKECGADEVNKYDNLMYSCRQCNSSKGGHWPNQNNLVQGEFVLNPFLHDVDEHLDKQLPAWRYRTDAGKWNIRRLRLSSTSRQKLRASREMFRLTIVPVLQFHIQTLQDYALWVFQFGNLTLASELIGVGLEFRKALTQIQRILAGRWD